MIINMLLRKIIDLGLFYSKYDHHSGLIRYADVGYFSDPHKTYSQTGYIFTYSGITISWRYKEKLVDIYSNHVDILTLYKTNQECVRFKFVIEHIKSSFVIH